MPAFEEEVVDKDRDAFIAEANYPLAKNAEVPQIISQGKFSETNVNLRINFSTALRIQTAVAADAHHEAFGTGKRISDTIARLGELYASLQVKAEDPKTRRMLIGKALAQHFSDECLELCKARREALEGRTGGRAKAANEN